MNVSEKGRNTTIGEPDKIEVDFLINSPGTYDNAIAQVIVIDYIHIIERRPEKTCFCTREKQERRTAAR